MRNSRFHRLTAGTALLALAGLLLAGAHMAVPHEDGHGADHCAICTVMHGASPAAAAGVATPPPAPVVASLGGTAPDPVTPEPRPSLSPRAPPLS